MKSFSTPLSFNFCRLLAVTSSTQRPCVILTQQFATILNLNDMIYTIHWDSSTTFQAIFTQWMPGLIPRPEPLPCCGAVERESSLASLTFFPLGYSILLVLVTIARLVSGDCWTTWALAWFVWSLWHSYTESPARGVLAFYDDITVI